jgi:hypothetical protein
MMVNKTKNLNSLSDTSPLISANDNFSFVEIEINATECINK